MGAGTRKGSQRQCTMTYTQRIQVSERAAGENTRKKSGFSHEIFAITITHKIKSNFYSFNTKRLGKDGKHNNTT